MDTGNTKSQQTFAAPQKDPELAASESRVKDAQAAAARRQSDAADRDAELRRGDGRTVTDTRSPGAVAGQHAKVDEEREKRNEENRPGHEKNMERAEAEAAEAHARTEHSNNHLAGHTPTGKQENRNTPRVLGDGSKVWDK